MLPVILEGLGRGWRLEMDSGNNTDGERLTLVVGGAETFPLNSNTKTQL